MHKGSFEGVGDGENDGQTGDGRIYKGSFKDSSGNSCSSLEQ